MKFSMTGQENGDLLIQVTDLIEVTAWVCWSLLLIVSFKRSHPSFKVTFVSAEGVAF